MTASGMMDAVECVKDELKRKRSEEEFNTLLARVNTSIEELELEPLRLLGQKKVPVRFTGSGAAHKANSVLNITNLLNNWKYVSRQKT